MPRLPLVLLSTLLAASAIRCSRDLELAPPPGKGGALTGRLVTRQALTGALEPAAGATLEFLRGGPRAVAGEDGRFSVRPPEGDWQLLIRGGCNEDRSVCTRQKVLGSSELPLDPDVDLSLGDVVLADNGEIRGRVRLADRQAGFGGIAVYVPGAPFRAETGDDGSFVMTNVPEGTLTVGFFLAGYEPGTRTGVRVSPASSTELAEVELPPTPPSGGTATIRGRVTRADGAPGDVHVEALRQGDASAAGVLDVRAGEDFVLEPLPIGLYVVTAEAEGFGRAVLPNLLLHRDVTLDLDVGTVVVPEGFDPTGQGGSGGTGGSGGAGGSGGSPAGSCEDDPEERGPCVVEWSPPTDGVLPALGTVTLMVDKPLVAGTVSVVFRSSLGVLVDGVSEYAPPGFNAGAGGSGGGTGGSGLGRIAFRPSRPLTPGTWTALLTSEVRDTDGRPAPQVGPTWLVTGVEAGPAVSGASKIDVTSYGVHVSLSTAGDDVWALHTQSNANNGMEVHGEQLVTTQVPYVYTLFSAGRFYWEQPPAFVPTTPGYPVVVDFAMCRTGGYAPRAARMDPWAGTVFNAVAKDCSDSFAISRRAPLLVAGWQSLRGQIALTTGDETGLATTFGPLQEKGTGYAGLDVFDVIAAEGPAGSLGPDRRMIAGVRYDPLGGRVLDVLEVGEGGTLTPLPGVVAPGVSENLGGPAIGCSAAGWPVLLYTLFTSKEEQLANASVHDGKGWIPVPPPTATRQFQPLRCITYGETPFAFWIEESSLKAAYLLLDQTAPEKSRWVDVRDRRQATGALNVTEASCYVSAADVLIDPTSDGLLFAYHQSCSTTATSYGELRFGRLY